MTGLRGWLRGLFDTERTASSPSTAHVLSAPPGTSSLAEDNNRFALAMFRQLRQPSRNLFMSPLSIRVALGMTCAGARGETASQMRSALCISSPEDALHGGITQTVEQLGASGGEYQLAVANSLWAQEGAPLQPEFVEVITKHYRGYVNLVDFHNRADAARVRINQWVEDNTRQKIRELIPAGVLNETSRLVLANAVHFKGKWEQPFRKEATKDEPFSVESGATVQAPLMHYQKQVRYLQARNYQAVDLPYRGDRLSMLVLLPNQKNGLKDLENALSAQMLRECVAQMFFREVRLFLPRFRINWGTVDLRGPLEALGMALPFTPFRADFSGINGRQPPDDDSLFISAVFHQAFVETNEEGTEAAAATAVTMLLTRRAMPSEVAIPVFRADHPFLFAIRDQKSGAFLFLGRVVDPTQEP